MRIFISPSFSVPIIYDGVFWFLYGVKLIASCKGNTNDYNVSQVSLVVQIVVHYTKMGVEVLVCTNEKVGSTSLVY